MKISVGHNIVSIQYLKITVSYYLFLNDLNVELH